MRISVLGLGYVGCVTAACLAHEGHDVVGVDVNRQKVELLSLGQAPVVEPGLDALVQSTVAAGRLRVSTDAAAAVRASDISLVCVGTPSNDNGSLNLTYVENVCREIGAALAGRDAYHVVVIRSTVLPGTVETRLIPLLEEASGRCAGRDFGVVMNPEFLREGSAIRDYLAPSLVVIGQIDARAGDLVRELYAPVDAPVVQTPLAQAEMVKYASNAFHALKVVFANEIGTVCKAHGLDGRQVMDLVGADRKLNISTAYLTPGNAFGGSCLPKDLRALLHRAKELDLECDVLNAVLPSNQRQVERGIRLVEATKRKRVGVLGLSFKQSTDDLRESPAITLVETLVGRGYQVSIFDDNVELSRLVGANKSFLERELPHIASLMRASIDDVLAASDVIVVTQGGAAFHDVPRRLRPDHTLIDLVGVAENGVAKNGVDRPAAYAGICW